MGVMMYGVIGLMDVVNQYEFLKTVKYKKPDNHGDHCSGSINSLVVREFKNLRQNLKTNDSHEHTSGEAEKKVQFIMEFERK